MGSPMSPIDMLSVVVVREPIVAFRVVRGSSLQQQDVLESFRSNYELDRPPRGIEGRIAVIQMGISMFRRRGQAEGLARRFPVIGDQIARMSLTGGRGFAYADTGPVGHMTVWGRPVQLVEAIVDIKPVTA
jgi:hypothetical protein